MNDDAFLACVEEEIQKGRSKQAAERLCRLITKERVEKAVETENPLEALSSDEIETMAESQLENLVEKSRENVCDVAFIVGEGDNEKVVSINDIFTTLVVKSVTSNRLDKTEVYKGIEGSRQSTKELKSENSYSIAGSEELIEPPYDPNLMLAFLDLDEIHFRCCRVKTSDAVSREYSLESDYPIKTDKERAKNAVSQDVVNEEIDIISKFLRNCNSIIGFSGVLERASMDYEGVGWAAIEVIRGMDKKVKRLAHVPAARVRVLAGWKGFVELLDDGRKKIYYQPFGEKVSSKNPDLITSAKVPYNPEEDGDISNAEWNLIDKDTGKPTTDLTKAANEILWLPKHHPATIYYGYSDIVPAVGWLMGNVNIRKYLLQFFEHNTVPRYAIIIEGAKLTPEVSKTIQEYFNSEVRGQAHKTLILPIPSIRGEVRVKFEKLDSDEREGSFQETKKNNAQSIMAAHGVSPAIIGIAEHSELGSGKGLSQAEIYKDRIVTPLQKVWSGGLNKIFRLGLGVRYVSLYFDPLDIRDMQAETLVYTTLLTKGCLTVNQVIKAMNLGEPVSGGDRLFTVVGNDLFFIEELSGMKSTRMESEKLKLSMAKEAAKAKEVSQQNKKVPVSSGSKKPVKNKSKTPIDKS
jgi:capsid portal protein